MPVDRQLTDVPTRSHGRTMDMDERTPAALGERGSHLFGEIRHPGQVFRRATDGVVAHLNLFVVRSFGSD
jgi:hypothetical protein